MKNVKSFKVGDIEVNNYNVTTEKVFFSVRLTNNVEIPLEGGLGRNIKQIMYLTKEDVKNLKEALSLI